MKVSTLVAENLQAIPYHIPYLPIDFPGKCYVSKNLILDQGVSIKDPTHKCRQLVCGLNGSIVFQRYDKYVKYK